MMKARVSVLVLAALATAATAAAEPAPDDPSSSLSRMGMELDRIRAESPSQQGADLATLSRQLSEAAKKDFSDADRVAFDFLSAEVSYARGEYGEAADTFRQAAKRDKKGPFADDAMLGYIAALEAQGLADQTAKEETRWEKEYGGSALLPETRLTGIWNDLRRGDHKAATAELEKVEKVNPWLRQDPRFALASAVAAFQAGRADTALACLANADAGKPEVIYLQAILLDRGGSRIKAAAKYQELVERFPASPLHDPAWLAKANIFLTSGSYQSAAEEFARIVGSATNVQVQAEAALRGALSSWLAGDQAAGVAGMRDVVARYPRTDVAARGQFMLGEFLYTQSSYEEAIREFNRLQTEYFDHELAATALFRVGRCLDALGRQQEATSTYQAVVAGYPMAPEAPSSAYLAGAGLLAQEMPLKAAPYFQLVIDRYALTDETGSVEFASPEDQELVEASLCLLLLSYHDAGNLGQLSGVPHLMLQKMSAAGPSPWRSWALLIDADALASQGRYEEAQTTLERLIDQSPDDRIAVSANRLLAWTYAREGKHDLAIQTEEAMLTRYADKGSEEELQSSYLNQAHVLFNRQDYENAATAYDDFAARYPESPRRNLALYQAGLCHQRLGHTGDAVDRWEEILAADPSGEIAEQAWTRAGDLYFRAEHYDDAKRCYQGLVDNFPGSAAVPAGMLHMAQCDYNAGRDRQALEMFSQVSSRFPDTKTAEQATKGMEQALFRLGKGDDGAQVLGELIERYPNSPFAADAQFEIATQAYEAKRYDEAAEAFRRVVSQFPSYASADRAQYFLADCYRQSGKTEEATAACEQFLFFFPQSEFAPTVRFQLGSARFDAGDAMRAAVDFSSVLDSDATPDFKKAALFNLALCQRELGSTDEAMSLLQHYRETYPNDERACDVAFQLGDLNQEAGKFAEAASEFEQGLAGKPSAETANQYQYRLGLCREELADKAGALRAYRQAASARDKSDPFRISALVRCAALYEENKDYGSAITAYRDLAAHATDQELASAAGERAGQLESIAHK